MFTTGIFWALLGVALCALLSGIGSAKGCSLVGQASAGLLAEDPSKFTKCMTLELLPGTQGLYGFITAFLTLIRLELFNGLNTEISLGTGIMIFVACLPMALVGFFSAVSQGKCAAAGVGILAKKPQHMMKGVTLAIIVEIYAILALLVSVLVILYIPIA